MNPDDPIANLLQGLVTAITPTLVGTTLDDNALTAPHIIFGFLDPQDEATSFPLVSYMVHSTQPAETPTLGPVSDITPLQGGTQATQATNLKHFLTLVEFNVWTTNATDRSTLCAALHAALDNPTTLLTLPDGTTARPIFQKETPFAPEPMRHLYRTAITYLCKHRMILTSTVYLVLTPTPTYTVG